jgi:hypothetical protein
LIVALLSCISQIFVWIYVGTEIPRPIEEERQKKKSNKEFQTNGIKKVHHLCL